jgi:putative endonuclease
MMVSTPARRTVKACPEARGRGASAPHLRLGRAAEEAAARFLQTQGAQVLLRNYRCRCGELDIVARCGEELALVEVRTRSSQAFGGAAASVDAGKRRRLTRAAARLLQERPDLARLRVRFDVMAVKDPLGTAPRIEWIRHAFSCAPYRI